MDAAPAPPATPRTPLTGPVLFLVVAVTYAAGALVAFTLLTPPTGGAVFFPPAGVTLAALVLTRTGRWPWVLAAAASAEALIDLAQGLGPAATAGFVLANTAEPLVGAVLLRRVTGELDLSRRRDLTAFVVRAVLFGPVVGATIGATTIATVLDGSVIDAFGPFWAGDGLGVLTVGGAILAWGTPAAASARAAAVTPALLHLGIVGGTAVTTFVAFWPRTVPLAYLSLPLLYWVAWRHGMSQVATAGLAMALAANIATAAGRGPWQALARTPQVEIATLQVYLAIVVLSAWVLAVQVHERDLAREASRRESTERKRVQALQDVTARLATAATSEEIADVIVQHGIPLVAHQGVVGIISPDGRHLQTWTTPASPTRLPRVPMQARTPLAEAARSGRPVVANSLIDVQQRFPESLPTLVASETRSCLSVPARVGSRTLGALAFGFQADNAVDDGVLTFAQTLGQLTAQALDRARLYEVERSAAHELQRALLPPPPPDLPGARVAVSYLPADEKHDVGGDWYDVFPLPGGRVGFAVGDVVGHDLRAAGAMGRLQTVLRVLARTADGPGQVLTDLDVVTLDAPDALMATVGYGDYDPGSGRLRYACAGHLPPLLVQGEQADYLQGGRSLPLGMAAGPRPQAEVTLDAAAMLVWFTDGLVERRDAELGVGLERVARVASTRREDPHECRDAVMAALTGGQPMRDDVALMCLRLDRVPVTAPLQREPMPQVSRQSPSTNA